MQQKLIKIKNARKTTPKWIRSGGVNPVKAKSYDIFNNQQRVKSTSGGEQLQNNTFMKPVPRTEHLTVYNPETTFDPTEPVEYEWKEVINVGWIKTARRKAIDKKIEVEDEEYLRKRGEWLAHALAKVWQGSRSQGVVEYHCLVLEHYPVAEFKLMLYFAGREWIFVQESKNIRRVSRTYCSHDEAKLAYNGKTVAWIEKMDINKG